MVQACTPGTSGAAGNPYPASGGTASAAAAQPPSGPSSVLVSDQSLPIVQGKREPVLPVTVDSCDGEPVEVTDASRIVTIDLYGTLTEIVYSLGLGENVVGRDRAANFPGAGNSTVVTPSGHDLSAEAIIALNPTVVLTDTTIGPLEVQEQLRAVGIPVVFFDPSRTLNGIPHQINAVASALGVAEAGAALNESIAQDIGDALALAPREDPLRATFLYVRGTAGIYLMAGPGSGADAMISAIGARDVGTELGLEHPFTPLTSEALVDAAPDVIVLMTNGLDSIGGVEGLLGITGMAQTPAGENRRIVDVDDSLLLSFGPRTGTVLKALSAAVYGSPA